MLKSVIASEQQIYPISRQIYEEVRKETITMKITAPLYDC